MFACESGIHQKIYCRRSGLEVYFKENHMFDNKLMSGYKGNKLDCIELENISKLLLS